MKDPSDTLSYDAASLTHVSPQDDVAVGNRGNTAHHRTRNPVAAANPLVRVRNQEPSTTGHKLDRE